MHADERSHKCEKCDFATNYKQSLIAHVKAQHAGEFLMLLSFRQSEDFFIKKGCRGITLLAWNSLLQSVRFAEVRQLFWFLKECVYFIVPECPHSHFKWACHLRRSLL